jgi:hypothetical protein
VWSVFQILSILIGNGFLTIWIFISLMTYVVDLFHVLIWQLYIFFNGISIKLLCFFLLLLSFKNSFYILSNSPVFWITDMSFTVVHPVKYSMQKKKELPTHEKPWKTCKCI